MKLSNRVKAVKPSPTLAITAQVAALRANGKRIIGLGAGEPDFDTPPHIKAAAIKAIEAGFTKYTAVDGIADLKQVIIDKFKRDNDLSYQPKQILVSAGGKQSFFNLCQATLDDGDEVIIPAPYWVSYPDMALLAGGVPVVVDTTAADQFKISAKQLEKAITPKTRLFVINSPSNPTGKAYTLEQLQALGKVLQKHPKITIASDDMYEHILWQRGTFVNILNACPGLYNRVMVLNGVSKAYAMTGWRIGYAAGNVDIIAAMRTIQSQSTSSPTSISQIAALQAIGGKQECISFMLAEFKKRHDFAVARLNSFNGVDCHKTDGTFYLFPNVQKLIDRLEGVQNDIDLTKYLLETASIAVVPGSAFGCGGHLRISIATSQDNLATALQRMQDVI